jgi:7-carboxy-7-deazaguanine synthase
MFGENKVTKQDLSSPNMLRVKEIFATIQGEGHRAGQPAVFIRLGGCNLRCAFCDTEFESGLQRLPVQEILAQVLEEGIHFVVITGGEPMLQDISTLCKTLLDAGCVVQVETAGTVWVPGLPAGVEIVCSPKSKKINNDLAQHVTSWKYIVKDGELDERHHLPKDIYRPISGNIYLQPMDEQDEEKNKRNLQAAITSCMKHGYRLSIQQHKIIGLP